MKSILILSILLLSLVLQTGCSGSEPMLIQTEEQESQLKEPSVMTETKKILLDISGAVKKPGVYEVAAGARVKDAIDAAGGLDEKADLVSLNQAAPVSDGQKIHILTEEEAKETLKQQEKQGENQINLNTADKEALMTLPGIGEAKAEAIIAYREEQNGFQNIEDIKNISGIKDAVFQKIKDKIEVH